MAVFLYYGPEKVRLGIILDKIRKSCQYPDFDLLETDTFSESVLDFAGCSSMLGGNRVIILRLPELKADDSLYTFIKDTPNAQVYIVADRVDVRSKVFSLLKTNSKELPKYGSSELYKALRGAVKPDIMSDDCLRYFIEKSGYASDDDVSLDTLNIYLSQLTLSGQKISEKEIRNILHRNESGQIWNLFGYILQKDITGFLKEYHSLDSDDIGILSLMLRNARIGYKACMCRQMGLSEKEISDRLNVNAAAFAFSKELSVQKIYMMMDILQQSVNSIKEGKNAELITVTTASRLINLI